MARTFPLLVLFLFCACGHPATEQECKEIVRRIATLELTKPGIAPTAGSVADQVEATQRSLQGAMMRDCVGRRLSDRALRCVREAKTAQEISDSCFK